MATTDAAGYFSLPPVPAGRYSVAARRIGYTTTRDSLTFPIPPGAMIEAYVRLAPLDGPCSGFGLVQVPKPWWKFW